MRCINGRNFRHALVYLNMVLLALLCSRGMSANASDRYRQTVIGYVDALLQHGRDTYGKESSPLFATTLDSTSLRMFEGRSPAEIRNIRAHDRMITGANPMHDQNLYQMLYALAELADNKRYAEEADRALKWFFQHCQSENTGLFAWGEHIGWDFHTETIIKKTAGTAHEYFRPWVLWSRSFALESEACEKFARGVWEHQIGDHETGNFSRHARWDRHGPGVNSEYPRHGGFYIATWAYAYEHTQDPVYLKAIETLVDYYESRRLGDTGAIPAESHERSKGRGVWPDSNLSLAVDLWEGSSRVPEKLAKKMRASAQRTDAVLTKHYYHLVDLDDPKALAKVAGRAWTGGYGVVSEAQRGLMMLTRYLQTGLETYRQLAVNRAGVYLRTEPNSDQIVYPVNVGSAIGLLIAVHRLTGDEGYLERADYFARQSLRLFFDDASPLPRCTSKHEHYEAITGADTLMMSLLELWAIRNRPDLRVQFVYNDR